MPKHSVLIIISILLLLTGCIGRRAFYMSPVNGLNNPYRTIPMKSDSIPAATYAGLNIAFGDANEEGIDRKSAFSGSLSRSHNFGIFQAHYGAGLTVGNYTVNRYDQSGNNYTVDYIEINKNARSYFFGSGGVDAGINIVTASQKSEWRILGFETSLNKDFGDYARFRERLPVTAATIIAKDKNFGTIGLFTEVLTRSGKSVLGFKLGYGKALGKYYNHLPLYSNGNNLGYSIINFNYGNIAVSFTQEKWSGFLQVHSATRANSFMFGANYRLSKR